MGVIRQQRSRFLDYLLPGHAASPVWIAQAVGIHGRRSFRRFGSKQTPAAKAQKTASGELLKHCCAD